MKIIILTVGKIKNRLFREAVLQYLDRASKYVTLEWIVVPDTAQKGAAASSLAREGESILKKIGKRDYVVLLDERGKELESKEFSLWVERKLSKIQGKMIFVIGGPYGVSDRVKHRADFLLSFSKMTFPHELCAVLLSEQLYRICTIKAGTGYHH